MPERKKVLQYWKWAKHEFVHGLHLRWFESQPHIWMRWHMATHRYQSYMGQKCPRSCIHLFHIPFTFWRVWACVCILKYTHVQYGHGSSYMLWNIPYPNQWKQLWSSCWDGWNLYLMTHKVLQIFSMSDCCCKLINRLGFLFHVESFIDIGLDTIEVCLIM